MDTQTYSKPQQSLGFLLHQSAINWRRALTKELRSIDLTPVQFFILGSTSRLTMQDQRGPKQHEIVENTGLDVNVASQVIRLLEKRKLLNRLPDSNDGRAFRIQLTDEGKKRRKEAVSIIYDVDTRFFEEMQDKKTVASALLQLI